MKTLYVVSIKRNKNSYSIIEYGDVVCEYQKGEMVNVVECGYSGHYVIQQVYYNCKKDESTILCKKV